MSRHVIFDGSMGSFRRSMGAEDRASPPVEVLMNKVGYRGIVMEGRIPLPQGSTHFFYELHNDDGGGLLYFCETARVKIEAFATDGESMRRAVCAVKRGLDKIAQEKGAEPAYKIESDSWRGLNRYNI